MCNAVNFMIKSYDCIIWDWNGTLIDDVYVALNSVNDMLLKRDMKSISIDRYYSYLDTPIIKFYEHLFDLNEVPFDTIVKEFSIGYDKHIPQNPVAENAENMLKLARGKGIAQLVISASQQDKIRRDAEKFGICNYFNCISGAQDSNAESKIHRAQRVVDAVCGKDSKALVVGDTLHDYEMAEKLGADCVLFSGGHQSKTDLQTAGVPVIDDLSKLGDFII